MLENKEATGPMSSAAVASFVLAIIQSTLGILVILGSLVVAKILSTVSAGLAGVTGTIPSSPILAGVPNPYSFLFSPETPLENAGIFLALNLWAVLGILIGAVAISRINKRGYTGDSLAIIGFYLSFANLGIAGLGVFTA